MTTSVAAASIPLAQFQSITVIGLGYIGLPTAAMFASHGVQVFGIDISQRAVDAVNAGQAHIEEGDLDVLVERVVHSGKLRAFTTPYAADAFIIAVPTPVSEDGAHAPDISYIEAAARSIAPTLQKGNLVVLESTSPVGTTARLSRLLGELRPDLRFPHQAGDTADVCLAYCPERIIPGRMLQELVENDRIIGGMTPRCAERAVSLYKLFVRGECLLSDDKTAEMVKLTENSFRDVNIAFANELSMVCEDLGIDAWDVIALANRHPRVSILNPGPGVGGHCIAVDPWFIVSSAPERARLIRTAREVNDSKPHYVLDHVERLLSSNPNARVACMGLAYKPDVDDFRESPAMEIATEIARRYPDQVTACDPFADVLSSSSRLPAHLKLQPMEDALNDADIVVLLVGHSVFHTLPKPRDKVVIDTVGFWR